jgi:hypothetical protein
MSYKIIYFQNFFHLKVLEVGCTRWRSWLKGYATNLKIAGSAPDVIGFFAIYLTSSAALWPWDLLSL